MKTALDNETAVIAGAARVLATNADYDPLVKMAGEAQCVLIGEASHGTHEFYAIRAGLTRRLIQEKGFRVLGVDPALEIAKQATQSGVETLADFFTLDLAKKIKNDRGPAAIIAANNVFAHNDDLAGMAQGVRELLSEEGVFIFEVGYLADMIQKKLFDIIYHEHLSYHSVRPLRS